MSDWILVRQHGSERSMLINTGNGLTIYPHPESDGVCIVSQTGSSFEKSFNPAFAADIDTMALVLSARSCLFDLPASPERGFDIRLNESLEPVVPAKSVRMND